MKRFIILRVLSKLLIPFIFLFGLYVQFHGDFGPGGGFQAGVIFAAAVVLYALIFGLDRAQSHFKPRVLEVLAALGVLIFSGVGVTTMMLGENFLGYDALGHHEYHGQHLGIIIVELGVGLAVFSVMVTLFYGFAGRKPNNA